MLLEIVWNTLGGGGRNTSIVAHVAFEMALNGNTESSEKRYE